MTKEIIINIFSVARVRNKKVLFENPRYLRSSQHLNSCFKRDNAQAQRTLKAHDTKIQEKSLIESGEGKRDFHYNRLAQQENRNKTQLRCTSKEQTNEHSENKRTNIRSFLCLFTLARANLQKLRP
jgi:hypothetical protein